MIAKLRRIVTVVVVTGCTVVAGCAHSVPANHPAIWELRGAIVEVGHDVLRVRHKSGQVVNLWLDNRTVVLRGNERQSMDALVPGTRVRVEVEPLAAGAPRARTVRLYGRS